MTDPETYRDRSLAPLIDILRAAIVDYQRKHGRKPTVCVIHPSMMDRPCYRFDGVVIRAFREAAPGCVTVGVE